MVRVLLHLQEELVDLVVVGLVEIQLEQQVQLILEAVLELLVKQLEQLAVQV